MRKPKSVILALTGILLLCGTGVPAAESPYVPPQLKSTIDSLTHLREDLDRCHEEQTDLQKKADKLAREIDRLRSKPKGGFLDGRRLRNKLQASLEISRQLEQLKRTETGLERSLVDSGRQTLALYQTAIDSTFGRIEVVESPREKRNLLEYLLELRGQKENLLSYLPALGEAPAMEPDAYAISPFDSPGEINQKGDFHLDLAERLEKKALALNLLLTDLRQERMVRQKMNELAEDTELFQGSDEFSVEEVLLTTRTTEEPVDKPIFTSVEQIGQDYLNFLFNEKIPVQNPETRAWTLIDLIRQAESHQSELNDRAALYRQKALYYYQQASEE